MSTNPIDQSIRRYDLATVKGPDGLAFKELQQDLYAAILDVIGEDEPQCNCDTDPEGLGYHGKWCEENGLFYGLLRNELKAEQRAKAAELFGIGEKDE